MRLSEINVENITNELIYDCLFNVPTEKINDGCVMIVFGCHIKALLDERLECALDILNSKNVKHVILSGGVGVHGDFDESSYMYDILKDKMDETNIILESESIDSITNVLNSLAILKDKSLLDKEIVLVSHEFHIRKLAMLFRRKMPDLNLIYAYPSKTMFSYDALMGNETLRDVLKSQVVKLRDYAIDGKIEDEEIVDNSRYLG